MIWQHGSTPDQQRQPRVTAVPGAMGARISSDRLNAAVLHAKAQAGLLGGAPTSTVSGFCPSA